VLVGQEKNFLSGPTLVSSEQSFAFVLLFTFVKRRYMYGPTKFFTSGDRYRQDKGMKNYFLGIATEEWGHTKGNRKKGMPKYKDQVCRSLYSFFSGQNMSPVV